MYTPPPQPKNRQNGPFYAVKLDYDIENSILNVAGGRGVVRERNWTPQKKNQKNW